MIKKVKDDFEILFVLDNLRDEDKEELFALYGDNWYFETLNSLKDKEFLVMYGYDNDKKEIPIAIGGFYEIKENKNIAAVWLISSFYLYINKTLFFKDVVPLIKNAETKYKIMYNYIYTSNLQAKNWLVKLGFQFDNPRPDVLNVKKGFEFFYKVNERV
ncbi:hypothetical protein IJ182_01265 [bacterium]|nr:hypothetical protein [bacterium]